MDAKLSAMDAKLDMKFNSLLKALGKQPIVDTSPIRAPVFSSSRSQVQTSNMERSRENNQLGYRHEELNLANRDSMIHKLEIPSFDGSRSYEWILDVEYSFDLGGYSEEDKMDLVPLCLQGPVKKWFAWVRRRGGF